MAEGDSTNQEISMDDSLSTRSRPIVFSDSGTGIYQNINATNAQFNGTMTVNMDRHSYKKKNIKPKKPVTKSTAPVTTEQLLSIKDRLGRDWKDLGRHLKFEDAVLEQMQLEYRDHMGELNYQILCRWTRENPDHATQANLSKIFITMSRGDLADLLAAE